MLEAVVAPLGQRRILLPAAEGRQLVRYRRGVLGDREGDASGSGVPALAPDDDVLQADERGRGQDRAQDLPGHQRAERELGAVRDVVAGVKDGGSARETRRLGGMRRLGAPGGSHGFELLRRLHRGREVGDPDLREKLGKLLVAHRAKALSPGGDEPKSSRVTDLAEHPVVVVEHLVEVLPEGREPVRPSVGGRRPLLTGGGRRGDDDQRDHRRWNRECSRGFHGLLLSPPRESGSRENDGADGAAVFAALQTGPERRDGLRSEGSAGSGGYPADAP